MKSRSDKYTVHTQPTTRRDISDTVLLLDKYTQQITGSLQGDENNLTRTLKLDISFYTNYIFSEASNNAQYSSTASLWMPDLLASGRRLLIQHVL